MNDLDEGRLPIKSLLCQFDTFSTAGQFIQLTTVEKKSYWNHTEVHCFTRRQGARWRGQLRYLMDTMKNRGSGAAARHTNHHFFLGSLGAALPVQVSERTEQSHNVQAQLSAGHSSPERQRWVIPFFG